MEGFRTSDHGKILSCLTEDVIWEMPGVYSHKGKEEFDKNLKMKTLLEILLYKFLDLLKKMT